MRIVSFWLCGTRVSVEFFRNAEADILCAYLAPVLIEPCLVLPGDVRARVSESGVEILAGPVVQRRPELAPFQELEWILTRWAVALHPDYVALHSGCVVFDGRVILFVAPSGSGKSTMTLAAVRAKADYVTDDLLTISNSHGHGFARAIRFKGVPASQKHLPEYLVGMNLKSYVVTLDQERFIVPLYSGAIQTRHRLEFSELPPPVVVRVARGKLPQLQPLSTLERAIILHEAAIVPHEAAITEHQEYDGSLGPGPTYDLVWRDPEESFQMLAAELARLKQEGV